MVVVDVVISSLRCRVMVFDGRYALLGSCRGGYVLVVCCYAGLGVLWVFGV